MNNVLQLYNRAVNFLEKLDWLPILLARLSMGSIFILTGWGKLHSIPKVTEFFISLGIPFPAFNAGLVGSTEFFGGILILLGLFTRLASIPLSATMVVAIVTAKAPDVSGISDLLGFEEFGYLVFFLWMLVQGAGKFSLDNFLWKRFAKS